MWIGTRNQLAGVVTKVFTAGVMAEVTVDVAGEPVVAAVLRHDLELLGVEPGDPVVAVFNETQVMIAKGVGPTGSLAGLPPWPVD